VVSLRRGMVLHSEGIVTGDVRSGRGHARINQLEICSDMIAVRINLTI
jgi:hypothetical protein